MSNLLDVNDFKDMRVVHLQLGSECNMRCRHCHQTPDKEIMCLSFIKVSEETLTFLDNFVRYSQKDIFKKEAETKGFLFRINFYGGEPLLHWNIIKDIVKKFTDKYNLLSSNSLQFSLVSNGLKLTEEIVEFVNQYKINFELSYDAPYPWAVRDYVSDDICSLANKIDSLQIVCSGCAYNCDPVLAYRCLKEKFPKAYYLIRTEVMRTFPEMASDIDTYDFNKLRISLKKIFIGAKLGDEFAYDYARRLIYMATHPADNLFQNTKMGICVSTFNEMTVTLDGQVPFCYNSSYKIGNLKDDSLESIFQKAKKIWVDAYDPACKTCDCRIFCYWGCLLCLRDKDKHMSTCEKYRKPFYRMVKEEMAQLVEPVSEKDLAWYREQEEIMKQQVQQFLGEGKRYEKEHTRFPKNMVI